MLFGVIKISRKGMEPSGLDSSFVNEVNDVNNICHKTNIYKAIICLNTMTITSVMNHGYNISQKIGNNISLILRNIHGGLYIYH